MQLTQVNIDGTFMQQALWGFDKAVSGFNAVLLQQLNGTLRGQVSAFFIGGTQFKRSNQFTVMFQFWFW
jgi:hypothetical protein